MKISSRRTAVVLAGVLWPVLVLGFALVWPGPVVPAGMTGDDGGRGFQTGDPPVDSGSDRAVVDDGSTRIFWKIPEAGTVELTIEINPDEAGGEVGTPAEAPSTATPVKPE